MLKRAARSECLRASAHSAAFAVVSTLSESAKPLSLCSLYLMILAWMTASFWSSSILDTLTTTL